MNYYAQGSKICITMHRAVRYVLLCAGQQDMHYYAQGRKTCITMRMGVRHALLCAVE